MNENVIAICAEFIKTYQADQPDDFASLLSKDVKHVRFGCVKIVVHNEGVIYVSFGVENNLITQITFTPEQSNNSKTIVL